MIFHRDCSSVQLCCPKTRGSLPLTQSSGTEQGYGRSGALCDRCSKAMLVGVFMDVAKRVVQTTNRFACEELTSKNPLSQCWRSPNRSDVAHALVQRGLAIWFSTASSISGLSTLSFPRVVKSVPRCIVSQAGRSTNGFHHQVLRKHLEGATACLENISSGNLCG